MPKPKRTKRFELRLSEKEEKVFYRNAELCEMTPTQYIRTLMFMLKPARIPTEKYVRILDELTDIRKTLNDIVNIGVLNENECKQQLKNLDAVYKEILQALRNPLSQIEPFTANEIVNNVVHRKEQSFNENI